MLLGYPEDDQKTEINTNPFWCQSKFFFFLRLHPLFEPSPAKNSEIIMVIFFLATVCLEPIYLFSSRLSPKGMRAPSFSGFDDLEAHHITQRRTVEITEFLFPLKEEKKEGKNKMSL